MMYTKKCYSLFIVIMALVLLVPACKKNEKKTKPHVESKISKDIESRKKLGLPMGKEDGIASFFDEDAGEFVLDDNIPNEVEVDQYQSIIDLDGKQGLDDNENEIMWQEAPQGEFKPVYFEFDCRDPREEQKAVLCENIEKAKKFAEEGKEIVVEGHACHSAGSRVYNLAISGDRAKAVAKDLEKKGIKAKAIGRGTDMPSVKGGSRQEQWPNRRVEMYTISN